MKKRKLVAYREIHFEPDTMRPNVFRQRPGPCVRLDAPLTKEELQRRLNELSGSHRELVANLLKLKPEWGSLAHPSIVVAEYKHEQS